MSWRAYRWTRPGRSANRLAAWFSRRRYGTVLDPAAALAHNARVAWSYSTFELQVERWKRLDSGLKDLAVLAAAASIGCAWCLDFGYWEPLTRHDVLAEKIRAVPSWQDSECVYRAGTAGNAVCRGDDGDPAPGDRRPGGPAAPGTWMRRSLSSSRRSSPWENLRSRMNAALGLTAQGFRDQGELPAASRG